MSFLNFTLRSTFFFVTLFAINFQSLAQQSITGPISIGDLSEKLWEEKSVVWEQQLADRLGASTDDFLLFLQFNEPRIIKDRTNFFLSLHNGQLYPEDADGYFSGLNDAYITLYEEFIKIKTDNPRLIEETIEGRTPGRPRSGARGACNPSCSNIGFQNGTLSFWDAYSAVHASTPSTLITNFVTGGPCGSVTQDAFSQNTNTYHVSLMNTPGTDPIAGPLIPLTPPLGGIAARVGDGMISGSGVGMLEQTFDVSLANPILTLQYAVVLQNPRHTGFAQPWFKIEVLDQNNNPIPGCGQYFVVAGPGISGFVPIAQYGVGDTVYVRPWTSVFVPLFNYVGQCITVKYTSADCAYSGHFGYAYVAASCNKINLTASSSVFCSGQQSATITGPPGAASYQWSTPNGCMSGSTTGRTLTVTCAGTYRLITTASAGPQCVDTFSLTLPASSAGPPPKPCFTWDTVCSGTPTTFNATCSNPNTGGKFYWDFFNSGTFQDSSGTAPTWTYATGGNYDVRLKRVAPDGCGADTVIKVTVFSSNVLGAPNITTSTVDATGCTTCNGRITVRMVNQGPSVPIRITNTCNGAIVNFTPPGSVSVTGGGSVSVSTIAGGGITTTTITMNNICPGLCNVIVQPQNPIPPTFCNPGGFVGDTLPAFVGVTGVNIVLNQTVSPATCGANNGSANINASGGAAPFTYQWSSGLGTSPSVSGLAGGTYSVTVRDANSCSTTATVIVGSTVSLNSTATPFFVRCHGGNNGKILLRTNGGAPPLTYNWSPNVSNTDSAVGLGPGTYSVTVTDGSGCSGSVSATITEPSKINNTFTGNYTNVPCFGTGNATANPSGGFAPYTFRWSSGTLTATDTGLAGGFHRVTITDASGCSVIDSVNVIAVGNLSITASPSGAVCQGTPVQLTGNGGSSYTWSTGATSASITVTPIQTTTYTLSATSTCGTATLSRTITVNTPPVASISPQNVSICPGQNATLTAGGGSSYSWSTGATTPTITVSPAQTTTYNVTATDANQCSSTASVTVTLTNPNDVVSITISASDTAICAGTPVTFTASPANGGTSPVYEWKVNGNTVGTNSNTFTTASLNHQDVITCILTSNQSCVLGSPATSNAVVISVYTTPNIGTVTSVPATLCAGENATLSVSGTSSPVQWQKSLTPNSFTDISGATSATFTDNPSQTTYYRVIVSQQLCADTSGVYQLIVKPLPIAPALTAQDTIICSGKSTEICAPDTFQTYSWNNGSTTRCTQATFAGGYWVSVTASNGCAVISQRRNIAIYPVPSVSIIRQGDTLSSFGAVSYQWYLNGQPIAGATSSVYIAIGAGNYSVEITDANGCKAMSSPVIITGIYDHLQDDLPEVFPNPVSENMIIKANSKWIGHSFIIYDVIGQVVKESYITGETTTENMAPHPSGLYFIKFGGAVIRFMKQ